VATVTKSDSSHLADHSASRSADEAALVRAAASGDAEAMERLLMKAQESAYRVSLLVCGHPQDAEDVMQDALLRTYKYVHRVKHPEAFRAWLFRTVRNACLMKRRRKSGEPAHLVSVDHGDRDDDVPVDVEDPGRDPEELAANAWLGERLRVALSTLHASHRVVLVLREVEGLSTREVAKVMGISEDNVKARLHRARAQLRRQLEGV
jgi:RNA polymerase sigma-70 factor (ECF subfamily)